METGLALILVAFASIVLGALLATGTLKELSAKFSSAEIHVATEDEPGPAPKRRRRVHLWSEPSFQISVLFGGVLLALGVFIIVREQNVSIAEREARISDSRTAALQALGQQAASIPVSGPTTAPGQPTPTPVVVTPRPATSPVPGQTPVINLDPTRANAIFKGAYEADQRGENQKAIEGYRAAISLGLIEPGRSTALLEIGLLSSLEATGMAKAGQKSQAGPACSEARTALNEVLSSGSAASATKSTARDALGQLKSICP